MADVEVRNSGTTVTVTPADRVVVRIPENATTGYRWSVSEVDGPLVVESDDSVPAAEPVPGRGGEHVVVVRARAAGQGRVALDLKRPWETEPIEHFDVRVDVNSG
jgi:inhibitor of cysteine peptidase